MKMLRIVSVFLILFSCLSTSAMGPFDNVIKSNVLLLLELESIASSQELLAFEKPPMLRLSFINKFLKKRTENPKWVAVGLCVALGPFGVHRMYLGTDAKVPIFYTLTLGGGLGVLPLIDLVQLLFTKDISQFYDNPNVFMWTGKEE